MHQPIPKTDKFPGASHPTAPPGSYFLHLPSGEAPWPAPLPAVRGADPGGRLPAEPEVAPAAEVDCQESAFM